MTTTHEAGIGYGKEYPETVFTADLVSDLRPQVLLSAPLPERLPSPPPLPNQIDFRITGEPTIVTGTLKSGNGKDLSYDDANHHVVAAVGSPRTVIWEATSESIDYTEITTATIQFTSQSNKAGVSLEIFVFNSDDPAHTDVGYDTSPDFAVTYGSVGTDQTAILDLSAADIDFTNTSTPKAIKIKIKATNPALFELSGDQLLYTVAGTPATTFFRDYLVDADPTLEIGSLTRGTVNDLGADDTDYYTVKEINDIVQWVAVSQPIALDTVTSTEVIFLGRATKGNPLIEFFVFNITDPDHTDGGFATTSDSQFTFAASNTDTSHSFFINATDLAYEDTSFPREVRIRVKGSDTTVGWVLEADRIIFRVKP